MAQKSKSKNLLFFTGNVVNPLQEISKTIIVKMLSAHSPIPSQGEESKLGLQRHM